MKLRTAVTLIELIVAATLIISGLGAISKLTIASGRLWQHSRQEQLAIEELSNQLERLIALDPAQRGEAIDDLAPAPNAAAMLDGADLHARLIEDGEGSRLELTLSWERSQGTESIALVGWIHPPAVQVAEDQEAPQ